MGFLSASASFTRYRPTGEVPGTLWNDIPDLLQQFAFQEIERSNAERGFGWVCFEDFLDTEWHTAPPSKGEFIAFALRLDTRRIPPAVFKKHYQLALAELQETMQQKGQKYVTRSQKQELKEQVKLRLLSQTLPIPAVFDVVWNTASNRIYFCSIQAKVRTLFEELFAETFGLQLEPLTPFALAQAQLGSEPAQQLEEYEPGVFV
jgi:DNA recombination-dependent growth factor C